MGTANGKKSSLIQQALEDSLFPKLHLMTTKNVFGVVEPVAGLAAMRTSRLNQYKRMVELNSEHLHFFRGQG